MGDVSSTLNREGVDIADAPVEASQLALLLKRIADGTISNKIAKEVFAAMWEAKSNDEAIADAIIDQKGLRQISDSGALEKIVDDVLAANEKSVEQYRALSKEAAINALIGQAMKASKGKANPAQLTELLKKKLILLTFRRSNPKPGSDHNSAMHAELWSDPDFIQASKKSPERCSELCQDTFSFVHVLRFHSVETPLHQTKTGSDLNFARIAKLRSDPGVGVRF
ncbi:hypothetical protein LP420_14075 [Massilia sp. B-10]|nr:hypothetical protein LP420_14075 [Massilia sp. B-10]